jgi:DNA polymerase/3'-5' exonuclease PolX
VESSTELRSGKGSLALPLAAFIAQSLVNLLAPACARIEIAGSIRRKRPEVGDIEIVAQPLQRLETFTPTGELFPTAGWRNLLDERLQELLARDVIRKHPFDPKWGEKYRKLLQPDISAQIDLFILTPPAEWGPAMVIRTGPADFSREMVTRLRRFKMRCEDLAVQTFDGEHVPCPDEHTFFELCGMAYVAPERRF